MFLFVGHRSCDINAGQQHKHKRLNNGSEYCDCHKGEGEEKWNYGCHDDDEYLFGENIPEESNGEGNGTGEMADDFYGDHERS
jgi:hypothetical protein